MEKHLTGRRQITLFSAVCFIVYFASYCTRINYGAAITGIVADLGILKNAAGTVSTGLFITYGIGQLISGILGDRIRPKLMIFIGLVGASVMNIFMSFTSSVPAMIILWCINGFFQAMLWPPMVRILSEILSPDDYKHAVVTVSVASTTATIAIYLFVPLCIELSGWRSIFIICAIFGLLVAALWYAYITVLHRRGLYADASQQKTPVKNSDMETAVSSESFRRIVLISGLLPIMAAIILHGILRDGIQTWMPAFIDETYHLGTSLSILTTVILPIFSTCFLLIASAIQNRTKNELTSAAILFTLALVCSLLLLVFINVSAIVSIPLMAIASGSMHGINLMLISRVPRHYARFGKVSTVSGLLNSCTYVGSATSTWGIALLSETRGWFFTIAIWAVITLLGGGLCILTTRCWNRFSEKD